MMMKKIVLVLSFFLAVLTVPSVSEACVGDKTGRTDSITQKGVITDDCEPQPPDVSSQKPSGYGDAFQAFDATAFATTPLRKNGAVFLKLSNTFDGSVDETIVAVTSGVADRVELHQTTMDGDIMQMRPVERLSIPVGQVVTFEPSGYHIMLMGLHKPLVAGETFDITLERAQGAPLVVSVQVVPAK